MGLFNRTKWNPDGWTTVQEADPAKHMAGISCRAEDGKVVEVRMRHSRGEESAAVVTCDGKDVLPISLDEFKTLYKQGKLDIR